MIDVNNFEAMKIGLASAEQIKEWSYGEVKKPETINYRTLKPERDGLFCERIFGPVKDWECHCGKYKRVRFKGVICDKCGVEVTRSKVRRERMGHIELASPVTHIWYFKGVPSRIGLLLEMSPRVLEKIIYFANFVVIDPKDTPLEHKQLLTEMEYREAREKYGTDFIAMMGAEAVRELLRQLDLEDLYQILRDDVKKLSGQKRSKAVKRLEVVDAFRKSGNKPEWMILEVVPVIPPELRPMVQLDGGRFATSDLNDLYRRVINRNNRLKRLLELGAPDIIVKNEKRMLQEAVDALIDNGRRGRPVTGPNNRPLKSLSDMLKGKQGRFRQNLLGKRVDYSGRSVIVVGPRLKLHQCGLPKEMALELFKPFVMKKLVERGLVHNIKSAKKMVERMRPDVWDVLEEVIEDHPVMLNRAPTLHRLGIQAFEPVLVEGKAIQIHPLVCHPYNADFDGDQMAVHLPLSAGAQTEARLLMLSSNNILQPSYGSPATIPVQDLVLGIYYMTYCYKNDRKVTEMPLKLKGEGMIFSCMDEAIYAYDQGVVEIQSPIRIKIPCRVNEDAPAEPDSNGYYDDSDHFELKLVETTVGRILLHRAIPGEFRLGSTVASKIHPKDKLELLNDTVTKGKLLKFVSGFHFKFKNKYTAYLLDNLKELGFHYATKSGTTVSVKDLAVPPKKAKILEEGDKKSQKVEEYYINGWTTEKERDDQIIDIWLKATKEVEEAMMENMASLNPIYMMATSGARGNTSQVKQLAGMRGLMSDPSGETIPLPIKANLREGLSVLEYFISTHGARKGLADTALRTADSGYLTRRLIDISQDIIVREWDCQKRFKCQDCEQVNTYGAVHCVKCSSPLDYTHTENLVDIDRENDNTPDYNVTESYRVTDEPGSPCRFYERVRGRVLAKAVIHPATGDVMADEGELITDSKAEIINKAFEVHIMGLWDQYQKDNADQVEEDESREFARFVRNLPDELKFIAIRSVLTCKTRHGVCSMCYGRDLSSGELVEIGETVGIIAAQSIGEPGTQLTLRTFHTGGVAESDIIQGLPRVEELFEARKPKRYAYIAEIEGAIRFDEAKGLRQIVIENPQTGDTWHVNIPFSTRLKVKEGDHVKAGAMLSEGSKNPHDILRVQGVREVQRYLVDEVQEVYRSQGVDINDKHFEVIVRQMLRKVKVETAGDTNLLPGSLVDIFNLDDENREAESQGREPATVRPVLLGVTKASLATDSFLSAASFQETTRVLTDAAIKGKVDGLVGLKENVIIGKMIPAGTGMARYRSIRVATKTPDGKIIEFIPQPKEERDETDFEDPILAIHEAGEIADIDVDEETDDIEDSDEDIIDEDLSADEIIGEEVIDEDVVLEEDDLLLDDSDSEIPMEV